MSEDDKILEIKPKKKAKKKKSPKKSLEVAEKAFNETIKEVDELIKKETSSTEEFLDNLSQANDVVEKLTAIVEKEVDEQFVKEEKPKRVPRVLKDSENKNRKQKGVDGNTVDLANLSFEIGEDVVIYDKALGDHGKSGKIVAIEDKLESKLYQVVLDIIENHNDPRLVNKRQKSVLLLSRQMVKKEE